MVTDPEQTELYGISAVAPETDPLFTGAGPARAETESRGGVVIRRHWSAGQRATVKRYFDEE